MLKQVSFVNNTFLCRPL